MNEKQSPDQPAESISRPKSDPTQIPAELPTQNHFPSSTTSNELAIGQRLGPYEIQAKLGQGGMGAVYRAKHAKLKKIVALKVLSAQAIGDADAIARFEREMEAVGKIDHPNIVRAMDAGEFQGTHYLAMEFVNGTDLGKLVKDKGPLSVDDACKVLRQAAQGLAVAHDAGLIHRDIKPANMLLADDGRVKLLDLGLARVVDADGSNDLTTTGQTFGTPDYMAPEQWDDSHIVDARADLYALGCTLFFLLTGRAPYSHARSIGAKLNAHLNWPIPDLTMERPGVPAELAAFFQRLMAKKVGERVATARELVDWLAPLSMDNVKPASHRPATAPSRSAPSATFLPPTSASGKTRAKRPWLGGSLAAGAILATAFGIFFFSFKNGNQQAKKTGADESDPPPAGSDQANDEDVPASIDYAAERTVAERLLKLRKGRVRLANDKSTWELKAPLPDEPFIVAEVNLAEAEITDDEIAALAGCRGLRVLNANINSKLTAAGLRSVGSLPRLETLILDESGCAGESLDFLASYPCLTTLSMSGEGREGVMRTLPNCPQLKSLTTPYRIGSVGDEGLLTIVRNCPRLTELNLLDSQAFSLVPLSKLRSLQKLHCWGGQLNDSAVAALALSPSLDSLRIDAPDRSCIARLARLDLGIRELVIRNQQGVRPELLAEAADWLPITRFANLEQLTILELIAVDAASLRAVAAMPNLKSFSVHGDLSADDREILRRYGDADIATFRDTRPDISLAIDGQEYPAKIASESK